MDPAPVSQIQFVKPSHKRGASEDVNDHPVTKTQIIVLIDPEDWYRSFYLVVPNASLFTIVPPPEESSAPTTSVANFVTSQSVVESNPPTAGMFCAEVKHPPFTCGKKQLSKWEVDTTWQLAQVRIHIERVIGTVRQKYTLLQGTLPISMIICNGEDFSTIDKILLVCCALHNHCDSVVPFD